MSEISVAAPPNTNDVTSQLLTEMAALTGVLTDYNPGSVVRTLAESIGSVVEQQGISTQALALQTVAFSALSIFGIAPNQATQSVGVVTFFAGSPVSQSVQIPQGTILATAGGVQFVTTSAVILSLGTSTVNANVQAVIGGLNSNVPASAITQIITGLAFPVGVINQFPTTGGADAQSISSALSQLAALIASFNLASPVSIANGMIGVTAAGGESVQYATLYEAWTQTVTGTPQAGFTIYLDNGTGGASTALIAAAKGVLDGNVITDASGYRPAGVPYQILPVIPVYANVTVQASLAPTANLNVVSGAISSALLSHFDTVQFGQTVYQSQIAAQVSNSALGQITGFTVSLSYSSSPLTTVQTVSGLAFNRVILQNASIQVG